MRGTRLSLLMASAVLIAACGSGRGAIGSGAPGTHSGALSPAPDQLDGSIFTADWKTDLNRRVIRLDEIRSGGPGKDGIPAIDHPNFGKPSAVTFLASQEPVLAVTLNGETHGYPYQIMVWHEIVNDTVGGTPVSVTFCPLCGTGIGYLRRVAGTITTFGTTGNLRNSDLVMYDRLTETWWQQATGEALIGAHAGEHLTFVPALTLSWAEFRQEHPDGWVLTRDTGYSRPYGENPYPGYDDIHDDSHSRLFLFSGSIDGRLPALARVLGVRANSRARAYPFDRLAKLGAVNDVLGGQAVAVFYDPRVRSALDAPDVAGGRLVGAASAWDPRVAGRLLTFTNPAAGVFEDRETETSWNLSGIATSGPLQGTQLVTIESFTSFWFAWAAFDATDVLGS